MTHARRIPTLAAAALLFSAGAFFGHSPAAMAQDAEKGQAVYMANCMACHGVAADGKGPAAAALQPPPTNFAAAPWWEGKTDDSIKAVIRSGKPGTPMMPFAKLSDEDLANLVGFLRTKQPKPAKPAAK